MPRKRAVQETSDGIFNGLDILVFPALIAPKRLKLFETQIRKESGQWLTLREVKGGRKPSFVIVDESLAKDKTKVFKLFEESKIEVTSDIVTTKWLSDCLRNGAVESKDKYGICGAGDLCESVSSVEASSGVTSSGEKEAEVCEKEAELREKSDVNCGGDVGEVVVGCSSSEDVVPTKRSKHAGIISDGIVDVEDSCVNECLLSESSSTVRDKSPASSRRKDVLLPKDLTSKASESDASTLSTSPNHLIITELQKLADAFTSKGDTWRAHGYNKAISSIRRHGQPITSYEDASKLPGVGTRMAEKVWEILERGSLRKVAEVCGDEKTRILELFIGVWGAGPSTAESWYKQGYRSLEDLKQNASLTKQQQVGLKHYDDFADRMSREEVERIGAVVEEVARAIEPSLEVILVGSYRRGKTTCGDADVLICRSDHIKPGSILPRLLDSLKEKNFITDDLVHIEAQRNQRKYLGVCRLPGENQKHRRLDIFVAPRSELAPALLHYTGSALFNRTVRLDASKKGMSLSEHCLTSDVIRQGSTIINEGRVIPTLTEASIFEALGMKYLEPSERNF